MNLLPSHGLIGMAGKIKIISNSDDDDNDSLATLNLYKQVSRPSNDINEDMDIDSVGTGDSKITSPIRKLSFEKRTYRKGAKPKGFNHGKWKAEEHDKYLLFRSDNSFDNPSWNNIVKSKKRTGFFVKMSQVIGTRSPRQCRSHDQKFRTKETRQNEHIKIEEDDDHQSGRQQRGSLMKVEKTYSDDSTDHFSKGSPYYDDIQTPLTTTDTSRHIEDQEDVDKYFSKDLQKVFNEDKTRSFNLIPLSSGNLREKGLVPEQLRSLLLVKGGSSLNTRNFRKVMLDLCSQARSEELRPLH